MKAILLSSLSFSVLVLTVLVFRYFRGDKYSRRLARALWIVVILRMVIPFTLTDSLAVIRLPQNALTERIFGVEEPSPLPAEPIDGVVDEPVNPITGNQRSEVEQPIIPITMNNLPPVEKPNTPILVNEFSQIEHETLMPLQKPEESLPVEPVPVRNPVPTETIFLTVWGTGVLVSLVFFGVSYHKFRHGLKGQLKKLDPQTEAAIWAFLGEKVKLFAIESDESPMTTGYFSPCLVLPVRLLPDEGNPERLSENLRYVLRHEYAHIQKRDLWLKALYLLGRSFQWFNPLAYLIQQPLNEDIELATDEEVAKDLAKTERAAYCRSILEVANALPATANNYSSRFTGDVKSMKKRISVLFQGGKAKRGLTVIALLLVAAVLTVGFVSCEMAEPTLEETSEPVETLPAREIVIPTEKVALVEARFDRDETMPRLFDSLTAEDTLAIYTFEVGNEHDTAKIGSLYEEVFDQVVGVMKQYPITTAEKPEFMFVEKDGAGKLFDKPIFYGKRTIIPYSAVEAGGLQQILVKGLAYESEPWVAYGLAEMLAGEIGEADPSLLADEEKLYLSGLSFEEPYVSAEEREEAIKLATAFLNKIVETEGQEEVMKLIDGSSTLDVYKAYQDWGGVDNPVFAASPDLLFGRYSYQATPGYDVMIKDGSSNFYFRIAEDQPGELDTASLIYAFLERFHNAVERIGVFGRDYGLAVKDSGFNVFTSPIGFQKYQTGYVDGNNVIFTYAGWKLYTERVMIPAVLGMAEDSWLSPGLTELLTFKEIYGPEIYEITGFPEYSELETLKQVRDKKLDKTDFRTELGYETYLEIERYYSQRASLDDAEFNYDVFFDSVASAWLEYAKKNNIDPNAAIPPVNAINEHPFRGEIFASYANYLMNQKGYSLNELLGYSQTGELSEGMTSYVDEWLEYIRTGEVREGSQSSDPSTQEAVLVQAWQLGDLALYQYDLSMEKGDSDYFAPMLDQNDPINAQYAGKKINAHQREAVIGPVKLVGTLLEGENGSYEVVVKKNEETIFVVPANDKYEDHNLAVVYGPVRSLNVLDGKWILEVVRVKAQKTSDGLDTHVPVGELYMEGELLNEKYGYDSAFDFQILAGKPFFFFEREGKMGISYDWQEYELPVENILHYACCSAGVNNPRHFENLAAFVTSEGRKLSYYELVNTQVGASLLEEPIAVEKNKVRMEVQQVSQNGDALTFTVKYSLLDWRGWGISNIKLLIDGKSYATPTHELIEQRYQKLEDQVCLMNALTGESCFEGAFGDLYRIERLTFSGLPKDLKDKKIELQIWQYKIDPPEGEAYCDGMRVEYIQDVLAKKYPGVVVNCIVAPGMNGVELTEGTPYADDPQAKADLLAMVEEIMAGNVVGPWTFVIAE